MNDISDKNDFTESDYDLLAKTSDAMTGWTGKPVVCVKLEPEGGISCALYVSPYAEDEEIDEKNVMNIGGKGQEFIGDCGGLQEIRNSVYACQVLWGIVHLPDEPHYAKVDAVGDIVQESSQIETLLPFSINEPWEDDGEEPDSESDTLH